jgi:hypothetical protein
MEAEEALEVLVAGREEVGVFGVGEEYLALTPEGDGGRAVTRRSQRAAAASLGVAARRAGRCPRFLARRGEAAERPVTKKVWCAVSLPVFG